MLSEDFWEYRWKNDLIGWDIGYPSPPICRMVDEIQDKNARILVPGCGSAYEAEYMVSKGFTDITLVDISGTAVAKAQQKFENIPQVRVIHQNFFEHEGQYDFIFEQTFFCTLDPEVRAEYIKKMWSLLKLGGVLQGLLFGIEFMHDGPPYGGNKGDYISEFSKQFENIEISEEYNSIKPRLGNELYFRVIR